MTGYALFALYTGNVVPGWLSTVLLMYFLGGVQFFVLELLENILVKYIQKSNKDQGFLLIKEQIKSLNLKS